MKHLLLISHGLFANGLLDSVRIIAGDHENIESLCIEGDTSSQEFKEKLKEKCNRYKDKPIVVISDIAGGSTTQCALSILHEFSNMYLISGLNLGLVLELLFTPFTDEKAINKERIKKVIESNKQSICLIEDNQVCECDTESDEL